MNEKKIMKKTCGFAKAVVRKTQEIFEISQLKFKMIQIKNKIERKYVKIGYFVYSSQKNEGLEGLKTAVKQEKFNDVFKELDVLYSELNKLEEEYIEIKSYVKRQAKRCLKECECDERKHGEEENSKPDLKKDEENNMFVKDEEYEF